MKTKVLVIGGGSIGERHVRCFLRTERVEVALCETNSEVRDRLQQQYPLAAAFASLEDADQWPAEAAVVATPAHLHVPQARHLVAQGRHVLIEKPLSTSHEGIAELIDEARQHRRCVGVAYVMRHNPGLAAVRQAVHEGRFGRPLQVTYVGGQDFPFYRPAYRQIYYRDRATGGGAIQDALTHMVNAVEWIVGPIRTVAADAAHLHLDGVEVEDTVHVIARHSNAAGDVMASYAMNQHQAPNESTLSIVCTDGVIRLQSHANRWSTLGRGDAQWQQHPYDAPERDSGFVAQAGAFLDALQRDRPPATSLAEGWQTLRACLAMLTAADERRWVDVEPVAPAPSC